MKKLYTLLILCGLIATTFGLSAKETTGTALFTTAGSQPAQISQYEGTVGNECLNNATWVAPIMLSDDEVELLRFYGVAITDLRINDVTNFFYIWEGTYEAAAYPPYDSRVEESSMISLRVTDKLWSGAGFNVGETDLSMVNDDTHIHFSYCSPANAPKNIDFILFDNGGLGDGTGDYDAYHNSPTRFSIGLGYENSNYNFPTLNPFIDSEWRAIDITIGQLKAIWPGTPMARLDKFSGNVLSILAGGIEGTEFALGNIYLYNLKTTTPPQSETFYIIGSNVNGATWTLGASDARFEDKGNGIYVWEGSELGSGFKINNGSWDYNEYNFGSSGDLLTVGRPFYLTIGGSSANIEFDGVDLIRNPRVTFDYRNRTVTVEGETDSNPQWFIVGGFNDWTFSDDYLFTQTGDGIFRLDGFTYTPAVENPTWEFKIAKSGWSEQWGIYDDEESPMFTSNRTSAILVRNGVNCSSSLSGKFNIVWNRNLGELTFIPLIDPEPDTPEFVSLTVKIVDGATVESRQPRNFKTLVKLDLDEYWSVGSVTVNGANRAGEDLISGLEITMDSDKTVVAEVKYNGDIQWIDDITGIAGLTGSNVTIGVCDDMIVVRGLEGGEEIAVYNLSGQLISRNKATAADLAIKPGAGVFVVRVNENAAKVTVR